MSKVLAYIRTSTDKQDLDNQRLQILSYADGHQLEISDFIAISMSSQRTGRERRLDELFYRLDAGDTLLVTELSRLGRSTGHVISLIDELSSKIFASSLSSNNLCSTAVAMICSP